MFHIWECREDEETARSADEGEPVGRSITLAKYIDVWLEPGGAKETGGQYTGAG